MIGTRRLSAHAREAVAERGRRRPNQGGTADHSVLEQFAQGRFLLVRLAPILLAHGTQLCACGGALVVQLCGCGSNVLTYLLCFDFLCVAQKIEAP